jgi:hypothetical protein
MPNLIDDDITMYHLVSWTIRVRMIFFTQVATNPT